MECDYGCGQKGVFTLRNGKNCCSIHHSQCPANRKKNSDGLSAAHSRGTMKVFSPKQRSVSRQTHWENLQRKYATMAFEDLPEPEKRRRIFSEQNGRCLCGVFEWNDKPLILELDHIDGNRGNEKRENLRLLCPNCHSQTPTWKYGLRSNVTDEMIADVALTCTSYSEVARKLGFNSRNIARIKRVLRRFNMDYYEDGR